MIATTYSIWTGPFSLFREDKMNTAAIDQKKGSYVVIVDVNVIVIVTVTVIVIVIVIVITIISMGV